MKVLTNVNTAVWNLFTLKSLSFFIKNAHNLKSLYHIQETINDRSNGRSCHSSSYTNMNGQPKEAEPLSIYLIHEVSTVTSHTNISIQTFGHPPYASYMPQAYSFSSITKWIINGLPMQSDICLKSKQQKESHHEAEKTHSLGQSKTQNSEWKELSLQWWVTSISDYKTSEDTANSSSWSSDSNCGSSSSDIFSGLINVFLNSARLEATDLAEEGWNGGLFGYKVKSADSTVCC